MRHRPSRVVALFHGQQVVVAPLRERGNALKRNSESTMRSRNTRSHTHIPRKSVESWRRDAPRCLSSDEALDPLAPPSCLSRGRCGVILEKEELSADDPLEVRHRTCSQDTQYPAPDCDDRHARTCRAATRDCCGRFAFARRDV